MKIGVITFWDSQDNYGQIMQCYALQTYLRNLGHDVVLIKYKPTSKKTASKSFFRKISPNYIKAYLKFRREHKKHCQFLQKHPRFFDDFRNKYIKSTSKTYVGFRSLWIEDWSSYDALICGSDQVWSYTSEENLRAYFLDFGNASLKRIAYAASFGRDKLPEDYEKKFPDLLKKIDSIGLREISGVELCRNAGRIDAQLVCDPTLLLSGSDYLENIIQKPVESKDSVFCYLLNWETLFPYDEMKLFAQQKKLSVDFVPAHGIESCQYFEPMENLSIPSWLEGISSSRYVVTNSFHGTVFSILMHKPFISCPLLGGSAGMNNRLITLLSHLGLQNRIYSKEKSFSDLLTAPIDWNSVDEKLQEFKSLSENFLEKSLFKKRNPERKEIRNICFQTNGGVNHRFGGLDRVTEILADYFERRGFNVYYLSFIYRSGTENDRQYYLPNSKKLKSKENIRFYNDFLKKKNIDVLINQEGNVDIILPCLLENRPLLFTALHFAPNYIPDYYFFNKISKLEVPAFFKEILKKTLICTGLNNYFLQCLRKKLQQNYYKQIQCCDCFILLSEYFKKDLSFFFPKQLPCNVIAINNPATFSLDKNNVDLFRKQNVLLYVGRLEIGQKRLDLLLKIWKKISLKNKDWKLKIVGEGPDRTFLEQMVVDLKIERVSFEGQQNPRIYYEEASIFCLTSGCAEGWGMVLVEAQTYGCIPIVFNSYSSVYDIISNEKSGFIIDELNEDEYENKILTLMGCSQLRDKMAMNCIEQAKHFSIERIGEQWIDLFTSNINKRSISF